MTRNTLTAVSATVFLHACVQNAPQAPFEEQLSRIVEDHDLAGAALAVAIGDDVVWLGAAGCAMFSDTTPQTCVRALKPSSKMRVASITKMAVALVAHDLARNGVVDLDTDVSQYLEAPLRNPSFPDRAITLRQLLSHTSSLRDPEEYWVTAPGKIDQLLSDPTLFASADPLQDAGPGAYFSYANVNYPVVGAALERAAGARLDHLLRDLLLKPLGLDAGLNWSGVAREARRAGAGLYRRENDAWTVQVDSAEDLMSDDILFPGRENVDTDALLSQYRPGDNPTLFSPQGGLRASVLDLVVILDRLRGDCALCKPVWRYDAEARNGDPNDGVFHAFGTGVQMISADGNPLNQRLYGHAGVAYGLYAGAWYAPSQDMRIAFAINGTGAPVNEGAHAVFNAPEEALMTLAVDAAKGHYHFQKDH